MSQSRSISTKAGGSALMHLIALILVYALFGDSLWAARLGLPGRSAVEETNKKATLQERILEVPRGTMLEVRLLNKQKLRGRLGEVTSEGFGLQTVRGTKIETQNVAFSDVKNFKSVEETTGTKVGHGVIYALAGAGVLIVVGIVCAMARTSG